MIYPNHNNTESHWKMLGTREVLGISDDNPAALDIYQC
ncbi:hypothetical protein MITS9509_03155 [Synechococcus sp. MIT S9509]|nr:hypothetical protein MITS9504_03061 [Synechococcus sp. MIT S9504]KZR88829.1 hypothetical protein MITS9509_03155 [Synechococcus sp. MIT S9509]